MKKRKQSDTSKDDPVNILRSTVKGFDIAYSQDAYMGPDGEDNKIRGSEPTPAETEAWKRPRHPTNPELKLLDSYPLLPDFDAVPDSGSYQIVKFTANPTQATDARDTRMDVGLLSYMDLSPQAQALMQEEYNIKVAAHQADPSRIPMPAPMFSYRFFLPQTEAGSNNLKKKLTDDDLGHEDAESGDEIVRFDNLRVYDTSRAVSNTDYLYKEVAIALHDPESDESGSSRLEKAAYYYPLGIKSQLKPRRNKNLAQLGLARSNGEEEDIIDGVYVSVREPTEAEKERRAEHIRELDAAYDG